MIVAFTFEVRGMKFEKMENGSIRPAKEVKAAASWVNGYHKGSPEQARAFVRKQRALGYDRNGNVI